MTSPSEPKILASPFQQMLTDGMFASNASRVGTGKHQQQQLKVIAFNAVTASQDVRCVPIILPVHNATLDFTFQT